ncbi:MAG: TIGR02594 family protein [Hyphomicrobiales bacterium]|nr:TIGR02594 family protein [Hyphomicrobiales bacterium]
MFSIIDTPWNVAEHAEELKQAGVQTVIRYYNHQNSQKLPSKRIEPDEARALMDAGLSLMTVFQQRGGKDGNIQDLDAESGRRDSDRALELANKIGQPEGSAIYFAIDHDYYKKADLEKIKPYFDAVSDNLRGKYRVGLYGSGTQGKVMRAEGSVDLIWLAAALGWSGTKQMLKTDDWALHQKWPPKTWPGGAFAYDGNVASPAWPDYGQFGESVGEGGGVTPSIAIMEVIARNGLNLRRGPAEHYSIETTLPEGTLVHAIASRGEWMRVDVEGDGLADGFVHGDFLQVVSGGLPVRVPVGATPYEIALAELALDVREEPKSENNPRIVAYHSSTNAWSGTDDSVPWCSSFVNYCVEQAGLEGTNSQRARSWETWGTDAGNEPREGDIAVFSRKNSTTDGGHVAFLRADLGDHLAVLGGNQSDRVKVSNYPKDGPHGSFNYELLTIRRM